MTFEEAKARIEHEATEGVAYTSRHGGYPDRARVDEIVGALRVIHQALRGQATIDRSLAACLFVLNDQVQGNMAGAEGRQLDVAEDFKNEGYFRINTMLYAIFEDWADAD